MCVWFCLVFSFRCELGWCSGDGGHVKLHATCFVIQVNTLPVIFLKEDLSCACATEVWCVCAIMMLCSMHSRGGRPCPCPWSLSVFFCVSLQFSCRSTGTSTPCAINRSSIYILLFILISLASLTYDLLHTLKQTPGHTHVQAILNILSTVIPVVLLPVAYAVDTERADVPNAVLNIRQASERPFVVCL